MTWHLTFLPLTKPWNVLQELDAVMKDDYASLPFVVPFQKVKSLTKKSMNN
jgi:tRNA A58 N-methylase Trm61